MRHGPELRTVECHSPLHKHMRGVVLSRPPDLHTKHGSYRSAADPYTHRYHQCGTIMPYPSCRTHTSESRIILSRALTPRGQRHPAELHHS